MKRYLLSIVIAVFTVSALGTYYAYSATDRLPEYRLKTVEGNADEAKYAAIYALYSGRAQQEYLTVTVDGSDYTSDRSFLGQNFPIWHTYYEPIRQLQQKYRGFMRGKAEPSHFYQDEEWLIYAKSFISNSNNNGIGDLSVELDLLNKTTGETTKFKTDAGMKAKYSDIVDVQRIDQNIHILSLEMGQPFKTWDYVFRIDNGQFVGSQLVLSGDENGGNFLTTVVDENILNPSSYVVVGKAQNSIVKEGGNRQLYQYFAYDYRSGSLSPLPEMDEAAELNSINLKDNVLRKVMLDDKILQFSSYTILTKQTEPGFTTTAEQIGVDRIDGAFISKDRVYILADREGSSQVVILNATDGSILYRGEVVYEGSSAKAEEATDKFETQNIGVIMH